MREDWQRSGDELLRELSEIETRRRRDYTAALRILAELHARDTAAEHGYPTVAALLRDLLRITPREAARRLNHARLLVDTTAISGGQVEARLPVTACGARDGTLDPDHLDVMARALADLPAHVPPSAVAEAEHTMVTAAASMDARTLARVGDRVRALFDHDGRPPHDPELATPANHLRLSTRANGRTAFTGELEPEASTLFRAALSALSRPRPIAADGPDPRPATERAGDAFADLVRLATAAPGLPVEAGERPHLLVTVPLTALQTPLTIGRPPTISCPADAARHPALAAADDADAYVADDAVADDADDAWSRPAPVDSAWLDGVGPLDAASARRLACDARIIPAVLGTASEPLDLGRASYAVPTAVRRALTLRDVGCAFPGCDRPSGWCHAHHIRHWADGGPTALDNLVLLCGHHHRLVHHSEWTCAIREGRPEFRPPRFIDPARAARRNTAHRPLVTLRR